MIKIRNEDIDIFQGSLYQRVSEDGIEIVAKWFVGAKVYASTIKHYVHHRSFEPEDGAAAEAFADRIRRRGEINLKHWVLVEYPSLEERLGPGGIEWEIEQEDRWLFS